MASFDPYGTDLLIGPTGDLLATPAGQLGIIAGPPNCVQALTSRLHTGPGELALHPDYGSDLSSRAVGAKNDLERVRGIAQSDLRKLLEQDARFASTETIDVVAVDGTTPTGLAIQIRATLGLTGGEQLQVADLLTADITDVVDPALDEDVAALLDFDPTLFFTADELEADTLSDLNDEQELAADQDYPNPQED